MQKRRDLEKVDSVSYFTVYSAMSLLEKPTQFGRRARMAWLKNSPEAHRPRLRTFTKFVKIESKINAKMRSQTKGPADADVHRCYFVLGPPGGAKTDQKSQRALSSTAPAPSRNLEEF